MPTVAITQKDFLKDKQGRTFADVVNAPEQPFEEVLTFFSDAGRQQRMEDEWLGQAKQRHRCDVSRVHPPR